MSDISYFFNMDTESNKKRIQIAYIYIEIGYEYNIHVDAFSFLDIKIQDPSLQTELLQIP